MYETGVARAASQIATSCLGCTDTALRDGQSGLELLQRHSPRIAFFMHCRDGINADSVGGGARISFGVVRLVRLKELVGEGKAQRRNATLEKRLRSAGRAGELPWLAKQSRAERFPRVRQRMP